jgi:adenine-specific DNA-methyltransferase
MSQPIRFLKTARLPVDHSESILWNADSAKIVSALPKEPLFDLVVSSPPYNIGKPYEKRVDLVKYIGTHEYMLAEIVSRLKSTGSICWQVGNYVEEGSIYPLDYIFHPIFTRLGLKLRNRIVWHFGHGLHQKRRFSGRYEVVLWYTMSDEYVFDLDAVRVPPKYPGKRAYRGPRAGLLSSHPLGKNPEDVWDVPTASNDLWQIPNVKAGHVEKTEHPCQFPVALVERLVLALTREDGLVFDPFAGTGSAGVAALEHNRRFWGCEIDEGYAKAALERLRRTVRGEERFRSHAKPIFDHNKSPLSRRPDESE